MIYIENVYLCLAAPLLVASICSGREHRKFLLFILFGMSTCLLSAYINVFFVQIVQTDPLTATLEIAPLIEETMKVLPILFYLVIFEPKTKQIFSAVLMIAIGFATFENICYLVEHGSNNLYYLLIRGFGTGAMHIVCGAIVGYGLLFTWEHKWLKIIGTFGVLCMAITFHGTYNLLMSGGDMARNFGAILPVGFILAAKAVKKKITL